MIYIHSFHWGPFRLNKPGWKQSCGQWEAMKKNNKRQSVCPILHPQIQLWAMLQHCTLLHGAPLPLSITQHNLWPYSHPDRPSLWQPYPLNSVCLHEHWSMKHATRQNWDAEILKVNRHQTQLILNYIILTGLDCLKCSAAFLLQ